MGNVHHKGKENELTNFQRKKLKYDFYTFFDLNNDGYLTYNDFLWAKDKICYMSGWKIDSPKYKITEALFHEIWESLSHIADVDRDGKITKTEWLAMWSVYKSEIAAGEKKEKDFLKKLYNSQEKQQSQEAHPSVKSMRAAEAKTLPRSGSALALRRLASEEDEDDWPIMDSDEELPSIMDPLKRAKSASNLSQKSVLEQFDADHVHGLNLDATNLPKWLYKYLVFRFNLLDRTGDNIIDTEEFEYVLSEFGVSEKIARQAFTIFTENHAKRLDFDYFVCLFEEYYLSDDPSSLGNFINGKLEFSEDEGESSGDEDPGLIDHKMSPSTSIHSMDDDIHGVKNTKAGMATKQAAQRSNHSKLDEAKKSGRKLCDNLKRTDCCITS